MRKTCPITAPSAKVWRSALRGGISAKMCVYAFVGIGDAYLRQRIRANLFQSDAEKASRTCDPIAHRAAGCAYSSSRMSVAPLRTAAGSGRRSLALDGTEHDGRSRCIGIAVYPRCHTRIVVLKAAVSLSVATRPATRISNRTISVARPRIALATVMRCRQAGSAATTLSSIVCSRSSTSMTAHAVQQFAHGALELAPADRADLQAMHRSEPQS